MKKTILTICLIIVYLLSFGCNSEKDICKNYSYKENFNSILNLIKEQKYVKALELNQIGIKCNHKFKDEYYLQRGFLFNYLNQKDSTKFYLNKGLNYKLSKNNLSIKDEFEVIELLCRLEKNAIAIKRFDSLDKSKLKKHENDYIIKIIKNCDLLTINNY